MFRLERKSSMSDGKPKQQKNNDSERPRGLLAGVDREYIRGEKEYSHRQSEYDREQTIKKRVRNGVRDISILAAEADDEFLEDILGDYEDDQNLKNGLTDMVTLLFRVLALDDAFRNKRGGFTNRGFESMVEEGTRRGFLMNDAVLDDFSLDTQSTHVPDLEGLISHVEQGEDLSPEAIRFILSTEAVKSEPVQEAVRKQVLALKDESENGE